MFRYPLAIRTVSSKNLWIGDASGAWVADAAVEVGDLRDHGSTIRVRGRDGGRSEGEILRIEGSDTSLAGDVSNAGEGEGFPQERLSADVLKRRYDGPGVPGAGLRPLDHLVYEPGGRCLGMLGVRSHWQGLYDVADASGVEIGRILKERMFSRDCDVEMRGIRVMSLRRRGLFSGAMALARHDAVTISEDEEKLLIAGVVFLLLGGADG